MSDDTTTTPSDATATSAGTGRPHGVGTPEVAPAPRPRRRTGTGSFFAAWIGIGAIIGGLAGVVLAATTQGPALVSTQRSFMWLGVFFACLGALVGAVVSVLVDAAAQRRR